MARRRTFTVLAALTAGTLALGVAAAVTAYATTDPRGRSQRQGDVTVQAGAVRPKLVINQDFPDPDVQKVGTTYYAYATNSGRNLPWATAPAPDGPWTVQGTDALPTLGAWAQPGRTWAPDVSRRSDGQFLLYYTAWHRASGRQCIGAALATAPGGPFTPVGTQPLVCTLNDGGSIDASSFVDTDGTRYLLYKNDGNAIGVTTWIWLQKVAADGIGFIGGAVRLMRNDRPDEAGIIEAPVLTKVSGRYVLFYAAGPYWTDQYGTSYGVATSITGPYSKAYRFLMTTASLDGSVNGPGGADVLRDAGGDRIFFHGHLAGGGRGLYVADLGWANGYPVVRGSRVRYEGERGALNHCVVRTGAAGASQGAVVAYIDYADSWVDITVFAPTAGGYSTYVGYANGSPATATHRVSVNGVATGSVSYPVTGWDNWRQSRIDVSLAAGWNTIRFQHETWYAELDYIEVA